MKALSNVTQIHAGGVVTPQQVEALYLFDAIIVKALEEVTAAGVPLGLIVATLMAHTHQQTTNMTES